MAIWERSVSSFFFPFGKEREAVVKPGHLAGDSRESRAFRQQRISWLLEGRKRKDVNCQEDVKDSFASELFWGLFGDNPHKSDHHWKPCMRCQLREWVRLLLIYLSHPHWVDSWNEWALCLQTVDPQAKLRAPPYPMVSNPCGIQRWTPEWLTPMQKAIERWGAVSGMQTLRKQALILNTLWNLSIVFSSLPASPGNSVQT